MTHVALMGDRAVDRVRNLTTNAAPKVVHVKKGRIHRQALNSKLLCDLCRIDLQSAHYGL